MLALAVNHSTSESIELPPFGHNQPALLTGGDVDRRVDSFASLLCTLLGKDRGMMVADDRFVGWWWWLVVQEGARGITPSGAIELVSQPTFLASGSTKTAILTPDLSKSTLC